MIHMFIVLLLAWAPLVLSSPRLVRQAPESCTCVPHYLCVDGIVLTSGEGILGIRQIDVILQSDVTPPPEVAAKGNPCNTFEVCCRTPPEEGVTTHVITIKPPTIATSPKIHVPNCGVRNDTEFVNTGNLSSILDKDDFENKFPWQAVILRKIGAANMFVCGGTLIAQRFVLTDAQCVMYLKIQEVRVRLGEYDTQRTVEQFPHQDVNASEIIIHPDFKRGLNYNEIALVYLAEPAKFAPNIIAACLPKAGQEYPSGKMCTVSGWGKSILGANKGFYSTVLKVVDVPLVDNPTCQELLRNTTLGSLFILHTSFLCAGGEKGIDACDGDGGGPLVCEENGTYTVAGIVAWGIGCGNENVPGVYMKVSQFTTWIEGIMAARTIF